MKREPNEQELLDILIRNSVCRGNFTLASGAQSDLYIDARLTTLDPRGARLIGQVGWKLIKEYATKLGGQIDAIGGLTMGADPVAVSIALAALSDEPPALLQAFVVRKSVKAHGRQKLIEGNFSEGNSVVVIDDVITTGGSTLQAIEAIEEAGGRVSFVLVLVDREEGGREAIEKHGHKVVTLFTRTDLIGANAESRSHLAVASDSARAN
jgi:orotate phosphoribosyltransferase